MRQKCGFFLKTYNLEKTTTSDPYFNYMLLANFHIFSQRQKLIVTFVEKLTALHPISSPLLHKSLKSDCINFKYLQVFLQQQKKKKC